MTMRMIISVIAGYLIGSISTAVIVSKLVIKKDVREYGSKNAGATNVARVFGLLPGVMTLLADMLKTIAAMAIGRLIAGESGLLAAGTACIIGHSFPVFFGFRGGKGVAVGAAMALMMDWRFLAILVAVFFVMFFISKRVSLCSVTCAALYPLIQYLLGMSGPAIAVGAFSGLLCIFLHRSNIKRLINRTEKPFEFKRKGEKSE